MTTLIDAAAARALRARDATARPSQRRHAEWVEGTSAPRLARSFTIRSAADGAAAHIEGMASVTGQPYEMWDAFGPYTELVDPAAFDLTLAASPLVEFTVNHGAGGGLPMAHTRNGTLTLSAVKDGAETGLSYLATVDPARSDVADALSAMKRGDLAEASFKFRITRGQWSPDWTEYHILEVDLNRGDVSAVNFGANPMAWSSARAEPTAPAAPAAPVAIATEDTARRVLILDADCRRRAIA